MKLMFTIDKKYDKKMAKAFVARKDNIIIGKYHDCVCGITRLTQFILQKQLK